MRPAAASLVSFRAETSCAVWAAMKDGAVKLIQSCFTMFDSDQLMENNHSLLLTASLMKINEKRNVN